MVYLFVSLQTSVAANPLINKLDYEQPNVLIVSQNLDSLELARTGDQKQETEEKNSSWLDSFWTEVIIDALLGGGLKSNCMIPSAILRHT